MENLGKLTALIVTSTISIVIRGYVLSVLWSWFIVEHFKLNELSITHAIGLSLVVNYLIMKSDKTEDNRTLEEKIIDGLGFSIGIGAIALLLGWIITLFN